MKKENQIKILKKLRSNSRKSLSIVSRETNIKVPEIYSIIDSLQDKGVIKKFTSLIDHSSLGYGFNMLFQTKINSSVNFREHTKKNKSINNAYLLSESSGLMQCFFKDMHDVENFKDELSSLSWIESFSEHHILETVSHESFLQ